MTPGSRWLHPEWGGEIALLLACAGLALALGRLLARRRRRRLSPALRPGTSPARDAALWLALACVGLALLGPRWGETSEWVAASGADVVLLLDVSRSMDARDVATSRLEAAQRAAEELLARLPPQDRVALAVFAGHGALVAPLTPDREALAELIRALDTQLIEPPGSSLGAGVAAAASAFEAGSDRPRAIAVLSDGEDPAAGGELGIDAARRAEARVVALAIGTEAGAQVPDGPGPLRDAEGAAVVTRRDAARLERLAAATGGALVVADRLGGADLDTLAAEIRRDAGREPGAPVERRVPAVQVAPLAGLAFALLALEGLPLPRRRRLAAGTAALAALALVGAGPAPTGAIEALEARLLREPGDARLLIELGLERGQREGARRAFQAAAVSARDDRMAAVAYYDLGVAALEDGDLEAARGAFFDALALDPQDSRARFNLEWTLAALRRAPPAPEPKDAPPEPPARELPPPPLPEPEAGGAAQAPPPLPDLDADERARLLARVADDPGLGLRAAAASSAPRSQVGLNY